MFKENNEYFIIIAVHIFHSYLNGIDLFFKTIKLNQLFM